MSSDDTPTPKNVDASVNDDLSLLTESSNVSTLQWAGGVMSKAARILRGENPGTPPPAEEVTTTNGIDKGFSRSDVFDDALEEEPDLPIGELQDDEESEEEEVIDFLLDDPKEMTYARRIALSLMDKGWYNPAVKADPPVIAQSESQVQRKEEQSGLLNNDGQVEETVPTTPKEKPSLKKAWAYFEHVTLPRYVAKPKDPRRKSLPRRCIRKCCKGNNLTLDRAEPGEKHLRTRLYSPISTPLSQMGDFGLGIGLYFSSLRAITILTLLAGLINIPSLIYYSGNDYSDSQPGVSWLISGSAICTRTVWVPCPDCSEDDFESNRIGNATVFDETGANTTLTFALHNDCDGATLEQGFLNYGTMLFVMFGIFVMNLFQKRMEVKFDEDEQTAQDYSIIVENPPPDATDPEEWRLFFREKFGAHVTTCTVAVDNDLLVRSLVERRELLRKLEISLPPGTPVDNFQRLAGIAAKMERERKGFKKFMALFVSGIPEIVARVAVLTAKVQGLAQLDYPATNVFITFETEKSQREVLSALSVGSLKVKRNKTSALSDPAYLFRGVQVLNVHEPDEPSNVRWQDLNVRFKERIKPLITTTIATIASIVLVAFIVAVVNNFRNAWAAFAIAIGNSVFPLFAKFLTNLEAHTSEGAKQTSLYFKIALFRWTNTAIVITVITPFTATLENKGGVIEGIAAIFFAEIVTTNVIQLADPMGHIQRHFLAPRGITQDMMNLNMRGQVFELAERYTNMTKILFLALWYCAIYPGAFFMCAFALFINYFSDRFSLMRTWARTPKLGTRIAKFSRKYFFSTAIIAMAVVSAYAWSGFPYDNLCINDESAGDLYEQVREITLGNGNLANATAADFDSTSTYRYCLQDLLRTKGRSFPPVPKFQPEGEEWMSQDQETLTTVYGWTSVGVMALMLAGFAWAFVLMIRGMFRSTYSPSGHDMNKNFSNVPSIDTYIPQVQSPLFAYPLVGCNIDNIDEDLFDWSDPDRPHSFYDITKDADELLKGVYVPAKHVFSIVAHWPPPKVGKKSMKSSNGSSNNASLPN